jgi:hypothetical protein
MIDVTYALIVAALFCGVLALFMRMSRGQDVASPEPLGPLHLSSNDVTTVAFIDFVASFVLQRTVPVSVWIVSTLGLFVFSCWYVYVRASTRYKHEVERLRALAR